MNTLTEIKNQYAKDQGFYDWDDMAGQSSDYIDEYWTEICIRAQKAALEKAAENAKTKWTVMRGPYDPRPITQYSVNKESITNPENLIR